MTQKIICLSGRKQSGKNTAANLILGLHLQKTNVVSGFGIDEDGRLYVTDIFGDKNLAGIFDPYSNLPAVQDFMVQYVSPVIKLYSFADLLKTNVCMNVLGLSYEQCYGSDDDKNSLTNLKWENMPGVVTDIPANFQKGLRKDDADPVSVMGRLGEYYKKIGGLIYHDKGNMTAREVLQFVGTEIFRKMYGDIWADRTIAKIKEDDSAVAVITDCRFPNEVEATKNAGGKVIRLTRNQDNKDSHTSETLLDKENYDWNKFDKVIENHDMSIAEQNIAVYDALLEWGWIWPRN